MAPCTLHCCTIVTFVLRSRSSVIHNDICSAEGCRGKSAQPRSRHTKVFPLRFTFVFLHITYKSISSPYYFCILSFENETLHSVQCTQPYHSQDAQTYSLQNIFPGFNTTSRIEMAKDHTLRNFSFHPSLLTRSRVGVEFKI